MPRRTDARTNAIATAARLFDRQGYHGTGLAQILAESGAPKGSFYFHFPEGKHQLGIEAVAAARAKVERLITTTLARYPDSPAGSLKHLARALAQWLRDTDFGEGCAVAAMTIEAAAISTEMRNVCRDAYASWCDLFTKYLRDAGLDMPTASGFASLIISGFEGAVVQSRARRCIKPVQLAGAQLATLAAANLAKP